MMSKGMQPLNGYSEGEEFSSNESGWTQYLITSPSDHQQDDENHCTSSCIDYGGYYCGASRNGYCNSFIQIKQDDDDNDSVASDASSGPSQYQKMTMMMPCCLNDYRQEDHGGEEISRRNKACLPMETGTREQEEVKVKAGWKGSRTDVKGKGRTSFRSMKQMKRGDKKMN